MPCMFYMIPLGTVTAFWKIWSNTTFEPGTRWQWWWHHFKIRQTRTNFLRMTLLSWW